MYCSVTEKYKLYYLKTDSEWIIYVAGQNYFDENGALLNHRCLKRISMQPVHDLNNKETKTDT